MSSIQLKRGNSPLKNDQGFVEGLITHVTMEKEVVKVKDADEAFDVHELEKCVFHFDCRGASGETFHIQHKCFPRLDGEKHIFRGKGRGSKEVKDYNKLTKTCLKLGLVSEDKLQKLTDELLDNVMVKLDAISDLKVAFKPFLDIKSNQYGIDLETLSVLS